MSLQVVYPQWRDQQRRDRSPFSDRVDVPDGLDGIFVDAALYVYGATGPLWLGAIEVEGAAVAVEVTDGTETAAGTAARGGGEDAIHLRTADGRPAGVLVGGEPGFPGLFALRYGRTEYTRQDTEFAAGVVMPLPALGVLSLSAGGRRLGGAVTVTGDHGVRLACDDRGRAVVHIVGVPLSGESSALASGALNGLKSINLARADRRRDFKFVASTLRASDSALRITSGTASLTINVIGG